MSKKNSRPLSPSDEAQIAEQILARLIPRPEDFAPYAMASADDAINMILEKIGAIWQEEYIR